MPFTRIESITRVRKNLVATSTQLIFNEPTHNRDFHGSFDMQACLVLYSMGQSMVAYIQLRSDGPLMFDELPSYRAR